MRASRTVGNFTMCVRSADRGAATRTCACLRQKTPCVPDPVQLPGPEMDIRFTDHSHLERTNQGLNNELIERGLRAGAGEVACHERLGGLLRFYHRAA